jgi:hypothetical protein
VTGSADLGSWPDAGVEVGLAAADAICQARAAAAGLANPESWVAWLSDTADEAYCRLHGLPGTKAADCGEPQLPEAAGPWVRPDGFPFSEAIGPLTSAGVVYAPVLLDELGSPVPPGGDAFFFTATLPDGSLFSATRTCSDWTSDSAALSTVLGDPTRTTQSWTVGSLPPCDNVGRLLCLETVAGPALPPFAVEGRRAFVTSERGPGDLSSWPQADPGSSGVGAGDSICRNLAMLAGFEEAATFKAWLSDGSTDAIDRFVHDGPWVRPDGVVPATGKSDLTDGVLFSSIHVTETGEYLGNTAVWTGTSDAGAARPSRCDDWTDGTSALSGDTGIANRTIFGWSFSSSSQPCDNALLRLYCLSDDEVPLFSDGFESGDTSAWTATVF